MVLFSYNRIYRDQTRALIYIYAPWIKRCPRESRVECSWPAMINFFIFKVENIVFADVFVFLHPTKTAVLSYNRLCFQVQVVRAINHF